MDLRKLSDSELQTKLTSLTGEERETTISILFHLIELENRRLYAELGYSSLFDYCLRALKYSRGAAHRRVCSARCLRENPEIADLLIRGEVSLCTLSAAAKSIGSSLTNISEIIRKSAREVEVIVAKASPVAQMPREKVKAVAVAPLPLFSYKPPEERVQISFSLSQQEYRDFERVKAKLSHVLGGNPSAAGLVNTLVKQVLKPKARQGKSLGKGRYIARAVKVAVLKRDAGQCCYKSVDGTRCLETKNTYTLTTCFPTPWEESQS